MAWLEQKQDFTDLRVYTFKAAAGVVFPSPAEAAARCLGVFYLSGGNKITGPDGDIPCGVAGTFTPWVASGIETICEVGPDGAEWLCFSCNTPQGKSTEQVDVTDSYVLPANTQAIMVEGLLTANGRDYTPVSQMLFVGGTPVYGNGTLVLIR